MSEKTFKIVNGDISDGFHTFDELYDHRCLLFLMLITSSDHCEDAYAVKDHYEGWDLMVLDSHAGQISYHIPVKFRELWEDYVKEISLSEHKYDGHTPNDVIARFKEMLLGQISDARSS